MFKCVLATVVAVAVAAPVMRPLDMTARVVDTQGDIIEHVNSLNTTWTAGVNAYWKDHTWSTIKGMCGSKKGGPVLPLKDGSHFEDMEIPTSFDPREQWGSMCPSVKEVRDQASCGSCWAFGAVESMTDRICIASKGATQAHLSAEDMNSCCWSCGSGCDGGYPSAAWQYWQSNGLVTGANYGVKPTLCYPYSIPSCDHHLEHPKIKPCGDIVPTPQCTSQCVDGEVWNPSKHTGKAPYSLDMSSIQKELMTNGPVESSFTVYADFPTYTGGVYQHTSGQELGGHAIKIMGWGELNSTPYWLVANSWNADWGVDGFFMILRGSDECGIESGFVAGMPNL